MKRSGAIKEIASWLYIWYQGDVRAKERAEHLLDMLEYDLGMSPPYDSSTDDEENGQEWEQE